MTERRRRRNAQQVHEAIQSAVAAEVADHGYEGLTFEGVARRAQMNKSVLYRRFPDRASMAVDALLGSGVSASLPTTRESLREDLVAWFTVALDRAALLGPGVYRGIVGEAGRATLEQVDSLMGDVTSAIRQYVIEPARRRGELGPVRLDALTVQAPLRALRDLMMFTTGNPHGQVENVVDRVAVPFYRERSGLVSSAWAADPGSESGNPPEPQGLDLPDVSASGSRRIDARSKEADLVAAAWRLFAEKGPDVSLRSVAAEAGVGIATLYRHFPVRADLVAGIAAEVSRRIEASCTARLAQWDADPDAAWHGFMADLVGLRLGTLAVQVGPAGGPGAGQSAEAVGLRRRTLAAVEEVLASARRSGLVADDVTAMRLLVGIGALTRPLPESVTTEPADEQWMVKAFAKGLS